MNIENDITEEENQSKDYLCMHRSTVTLSGRDSLRHVI